ncbi:hypothetical protein BYT27DRAFT_7255571 [Phlegmacium glaucopus]|nr:hypothetical protein BYT27DRAFT_7255571 [Phlegmacium glaucopus]
MPKHLAATGANPTCAEGIQKQASSNLDQDGSRKRLKAAPLKENQLPETTPSSQVDTDLIEDLLPPIMADTDWQISNNDDGDEEDNEDEDEDDEDKDKDKPPFYDSEIPGISTWDLLGEDFKCETSALVSGRI